MSRILQILEKHGDWILRDELQRQLDAGNEFFDELRTVADLVESWSFPSNEHEQPLHFLRIRRPKAIHRFVSDLILHFLRKHGYANAEQLFLFTGASHHVLDNALKELQEKNKIAPLQTRQGHNTSIYEYIPDEPESNPIS